MAKRKRELRYDAAYHSIFQPHDRHGVISVTLEDVAESDRTQLLTMSDDNAIRLATRVASLLGYSLTKDEPNAQ